MILAVYIELHLMSYRIAYLALKSISLLCLITRLLALTCSSLFTLKDQKNYISKTFIYYTSTGIL